MSRGRKRLGVALAAGASFGIGLGVSGMTRPEKVLGFLDVAGRWDATLLCVMGGAVGVHFWAYRFIRGRSAPLLAERFVLPAPASVDARLCIGAVLFGIGWGVAGYCPGPALVSLAAGGSSVLVFVAALLAGTWLGRRLTTSPERGLTSDRLAPRAAPP